MSLFSKLFGGGGSNETTNAPTEEHNGFQIIVAPQKDAGGYRIAATITKEIDGETKTHQMIRADVCNSLDEAKQTSLFKAQTLIDQQGDDIFD